MYTGTRINEINDGKIYAKNIDGECIKVGVVGGGSVEIEPMKEEFTYGNSKIITDETMTLSLPLTHKEWFKKRKGKRWVNYYVVKPGLGKNHYFQQILDWTIPMSKSWKRLSMIMNGPKKPRGKQAKSIRKYVRYHQEYMKNKFRDYTVFHKQDVDYFNKRVDELKGEE